MSDNRERLLEEICKRLYTLCFEKGIKFDGHSKGTISISAKTGDAKIKEVYENQLFGYLVDEDELILCSYLPINKWVEAGLVRAGVARRIQLTDLAKMLNININDFGGERDISGMVAIIEPFYLSKEQAEDLELPNMHVKA